MHLHWVIETDAYHNRHPEGKKWSHADFPEDVAKASLETYSTPTDCLHPLILLMNKLI